MYLSTFTEEDIPNSTILIFSSLYILAFLKPHEDTDIAIKYHPNKIELEKLRYSPSLSKYIFISLVNPPGYTAVTRNLIHPSHRQGPNEDFKLVEEHLLHEYLHLVNVISGTITLN